MPRHVLSAFASAATHAAALALLYLTMHVARQTVVTSSIDTFDPQRLVWVPSVFDGGGRRSGGDNSTTPAPRAKAPGQNQMSVATTPDRAIDSTVDSPTQPLPITARPMGDAVSAFVGAVTGENTIDSLGPGSGLGNGGEQAGNSAFDGPRPGWPGVTTPVVITQVKPQYTAEAMRAKVQGLVMVECVVLPDGSVGEARILRSLDPTFGLDDEAIEAARKWRFKPGLLHGKPVPVVVTIELSFTLR